MCFKNLPIEFDESGRARLREGVADPYSVTSAVPKGFVRRHDGPGAQLAAPPRLRDWNIDPMTRVAGALAVHTVLDLENRRAVDAHSRAMLFRGYEIILEGRDPRSTSTRRRVSTRPAHDPAKRVRAALSPRARRHARASRSL